MQASSNSYSSSCSSSNTSSMLQLLLLQQPQLFKRWLRQQRQLSEMGADFPYAADPYE